MRKANTFQTRIEPESYPVAPPTPNADTIAALYEASQLGPNDKSFETSTALMTDLESEY